MIEHVAEFVDGRSHQTLCQSAAFRLDPESYSIVRDHLPVETGFGL
jgi:hypothetical protein